MKTFLFALTISLIALSKQTCNKHKAVAANCYKGRLEVKGACANYTIKILEGNLDTSLVESKWMDEQTGKSYTNVFALGSSCSFPSTLQEGDEFYFAIDSAYVQNCMVCMMYYPKPSKSLRIRVLPAACQ